MFICKNSKSRKKQTLRPFDQYFQSESDAMAVLVFKTSLKTKDDITRIKPLLEFLTKVKEWSVDNADPDNVLRVVGEGLRPEEIITMIEAKGYECEVLP